jgi:hypothetical protein
MGWWRLPTHSINHPRSTLILNNSSYCKPECLAASLTDYTQQQQLPSESLVKCRRSLTKCVCGSSINDIATVMHGEGPHTANCSRCKFYQAYLSMEEQASNIGIFNKQVVTRLSRGNKVVTRWLQRL